VTFEENIQFAFPIELILFSDGSSPFLGLNKNWRPYPGLFISNLLFLPSFFSRRKPYIYFKIIVADCVRADRVFLIVLH
jgi:hypothetical protein